MKFPTKPNAGVRALAGALPERFINAAQPNQAAIESEANPSYQTLCNAYRKGRAEITIDTGKHRQFLMNGKTFAFDFGGYTGAAAGSTDNLGARATWLPSANKITN